MTVATLQYKDIKDHEKQPFGETSIKGNKEGKKKKMADRPRPSERQSPLAQSFQRDITRISFCYDSFFIGHPSCNFTKPII